ncbi:hypothetical protein [Agathobaculum sp. Marseille-P7918]|uniref:hypothetical protein n=1 Tax=Agathobaculum sp. Marseille-P7918 TaxID=2479843 RepID=UPI00356A32F9
MIDVTAQMENGYEEITDPMYQSWFDDNILYSYFKSEYPWTRLGYTYDWSGGDSPYGLTEFLIADGSGQRLPLLILRRILWPDWIHNPDIHDRKEKRK